LDPLAELLRSTEASNNNNVSEASSTALKEPEAFTGEEAHEHAEDDR